MRMTLPALKLNSQAASSESSSTPLPRPPGAPGAENQDPPVTEVVVLLRAGLEEVPLRFHLLHPSADLPLAFVTGALKPGVDGKPLDVRIEKIKQLSRPVGEHPVEGLVGNAGSVHVV